MYLLRNLDVKLKNIPALSVWPVPVLAALAVRHQVPVFVPILGPVPVARAVRPQVSVPVLGPVPAARAVRPQVSVPVLGPVPAARAVRPQVPVPVARVVRPQVPVCFPAPPFGWSVPA